MWAVGDVPVWKVHSSLPVATAVGGDVVSIEQAAGEIDWRF